MLQLQEKCTDGATVSAATYQTANTTKTQKSARKVKDFFAATRRFVKEGSKGKISAAQLKFQLKFYIEKRRV